MPAIIAPKGIVQGIHGIRPAVASAAAAGLAQTGLFTPSEAPWDWDTITDTSNITTSTTAQNVGSAVTLAITADEWVVMYVLQAQFNFSSPSNNMSFGVLVDGVDHLFEDLLPAASMGQLAAYNSDNTILTRLNQPSIGYYQNWTGISTNAMTKGDQSVQVRVKRATISPADGTLAGATTTTKLRIGTMGLSS